MSVSSVKAHASDTTSTHSAYILKINGSSRPATPRRTFNSATSTMNTLNNNEVKHYYECHIHRHHQCYCIHEFYEDDEVCRRNRKGRLEFGIVSRYQHEGRDNLKVFWTLRDEIEEQDLDLDNPEFYDDLRLVDRKAEPGDIIYVNQKRGEVLDVSWSCYVRLLENGMCLLEIPCERLEPLIPHYRGQRLEFDGWIGTVSSIWTEATLMFTQRSATVTGVTGIVTCGGLPSDQQPYPGRQVRYTYEQLKKANLKLLDGHTTSQLLADSYDGTFEAFVLFIHVSQVEVKWNGKIAPTTDSSTMPPSVLSRGQLKKKVRVLGEPIDMDWDCNPEAVERFYQYNVQPDDLIITETKDNIIERYMIKKFYDYGQEIEWPSKTQIHKLGESSTVVKNVSYVVRVLRFSRVLHVRWSSSGKTEKIRANTVTTKHAFKRPFNQFVQKKVTLAPYSEDEYGTILSYDTNDTMSVLWLTKDKRETFSDPDEDEEEKKTEEEKEEEDNREFHVQDQLSESVYDIEPHFAYGNIGPKQIVYRSSNCTLPEALFTLGWVRSMNHFGQVIVVSMHMKQEHAVYPSEVETTGMKIFNEDPTAHVPCPVSFMKLGGKSMVQLHGLPTLQIADELFIKNLQSQIAWAGVVGISEMDHFTLLPTAPSSHAFYKNKFEVKPNGRWMKAVKKDQIFLTTRINEEDIGQIWIKGFRDRLDLFSVLMAAPAGTPYEGGLYTFDIQLIPEYPSNPPAVYLTTVISVGGCTGNDCRSMIRPGIHSLELGYENVMPPHTLIESIMAMQAKLFTRRSCLDSLTPPNSAGSFQRREFLVKESEERLTNAQILIDVLDLMFRMVMDPPKFWTMEVINYFHMNYEKIKNRLFSLIQYNHGEVLEEFNRPMYPMMPLTDGFSKAIMGRLKRFEELIEQL